MCESYLLTVIHPYSFLSLTSFISLTFHLSPGPTNSDEGEELESEEQESEELESEELESEELESEELESEELESEKGMTPPWGDNGGDYQRGVMLIKKILGSKTMPVSVY